jgi:hypothetical protein
MLLLQIAWPDGTVARFPAGGSIEADLHKLIANRLYRDTVDEITRKICETFILFRTSDTIKFSLQVNLEQALEKAVAAAIMDLKLETNKGFAVK